jgi:hypothetical protein
VTNREAAERVIESTRAMFTDSDAALLTGFLNLAAAVDVNPTNAALWGQYRAAEATIREAVSSGDDDDFSRLMAELSADVRDAEVAES